MSIHPLTDHQAKPKQHPLGPLWIRSRDGERRGVRLRSLAWVIGCGGLLGLALWMTPSPNGYGTHTQLGIPACPTALTFPCPTCGMTTAFSHTVRGEFISAILAQPLGWLLAMTTFALLVRSFYALITGVTWRINWYRVSPTWVALMILTLASASWAYKILAV